MNRLSDDDIAYYEEFTSEYEYETESYDFGPYQSQQNDNGSEGRGFAYNQSIGNMSSQSSSME